MRVKELDLYPHLDYLRLIKAIKASIRVRLSDSHIPARRKCPKAGFFLLGTMKARRGEGIIPDLPGRIMPDFRNPGFPFPHLLSPAAGRVGSLRVFGRHQTLLASVFGGLVKFFTKSACEKFHKLLKRA